MKNKKSINRQTSIKIMACNLLLAIVLFGCDEPRQNERVKKKKFTISIHTGEGMSSGYSEIQCDSFNMINKKECIFWSDGTQGKIIATDILPSTN